MGKYINVIKGVQIPTSFIGKILAIELAGGQAVKGDKFLPNMVCIVDNGPFAAAGWAYSEEEYKAFLPTPNDNRPRRWYTLENVEAYID